MSAFSPARLIFRWQERTASFAMALCFLAVVAVHGLAFFLLRAAPSPAVEGAPRRAQVTFLSPSQPKSRTLLRWLDAQIPPPVDSAPRALGEIRYQPSFGTIQSVPVADLPPANKVDFPSAWRMLELPPSSLPNTDAPTPGEVRTSLIYSASLRERARDAVVPPFSPQSNAGSLPPAVYLLAVNDRGEVRFCFLQTSSGESAMDTQGERLLLQQLFRPGNATREDALTWGFATLTWGNEAFAPAPLSAETPSPPETPETSTEQP